MPQNTNLNVSPYFDDFDENKNFKRVLFKPGTPIQSRELTTLQSILQNQIDRFGQHFFKEGAKVIPGQTSFDNRIDFVRLEPSYFGININEYIKNLIGTVLIGQISKIEATIELAITNEESSVGSNTLYFRYTSSSTSDFTQNKFIPGELLLVTTDVAYGEGKTIVANSPIGTVIAENAVGNASIASINDGIYFLRGHFVKIQASTVILDQYSIDANARIGLLVQEDIVTSYDDDTLNDNAQGFSNYSAPGADRLQISATFIKKDLDDLNDENFIELMRVVNGNLQTFTPSKAEDSYLRDTLAKRTFDESGNYVVKPFEVFVKENLNDGLGNNGVYYDDQTTPSGLAPSESVLTLDISPGKAYIQGYDVEKITSNLIDIDKPRTSKTVSNFSLTFESSARVEVNNIYGTPRVGITTSDVIQLSDSRIDNSTPSALPGNQIGVARLYDFYSQDSKYNNDNTNFNCLIYDIETYTGITISSNITLNAPAKIEGLNSGASGYLKTNVSASNSLTLYSTKGKFLPGEALSVNGISSSPTVTTVRDYNFFDTKSIRSVDAGTSQVFTADLILDKTKLLAPSSTQFTITSGGTVTLGISTASTTVPVVGDIISYTKSGNEYPTYNTVTAVNTNAKSFTVTGITSVGAGSTALIDGALPAATITANDLVVLQPNLKDNNIKDMYESLPVGNVSSLNLTNSKLEIRKTYIGSVASNAFTIVESDPNLFFKSFSVNEYQLSYTDGTVEPLKTGSITITNGGKTLTITQLSKTSSSNAKLIATLDKINLTTKKKNLVKCATLTINRSARPESGTGANTLNDGLTYNAIYGTRVHDKEICLNVADVLSIQDIYESYDTNDPILPSIDLEEIVGDLTLILPGQVINGKSSGARAKVISTTSSNIQFSYVNDLIFIKGETIDFIDSDTSGKVSSVNQYSKDISNNYSFDTGSRSEFVDYGRIIRKSGQESPNRKITIVFNYYTTPSGDSGDFVAFSSFDPALYGNSIPYVVDNVRATDAIDIRPRVADYNPSTATLSPFEWSSRNFNSNAANVVNPIISGSQILLGYSFYLGRIDIVYLNKNGNFEIKSGAPSENITPPISSGESLDIALLSLPPYVYDAKEVSVSPVKHKRYTMKDIERLEQRISNVEKLTSLSMLESNTKNLTIKDAATGLDRFKSGFFVDSFNNHESHTIAHPDFKASIDATEGILRPSHYTTCIDLAYSNVLTDTSVNVKKTGKLITLDYIEIERIKQPFATRIENVNPFSIVTWTGTLTLSPASDTWFDEKKLKVNDVKQEGDYNAMLQTTGADPNSGFSPVDWGAWETSWSGKELVDSRLVSRNADTITVPTAYQVVEKNKKGKDVKVNKPVTNTSAKDTGKPIYANVYVWEDDYELTYKTKDIQERKGVQFRVTEKIDTVSLGNRIVGREIIPFMRSRNIEFTAKRVKPSTTFYAFFNKIDVTKFVTPKLLEIEMVSGTFIPGETIVGNSVGTDSANKFKGRRIEFNLANANHKYGDILSPSEVYENNPYNLTELLPTKYSTSSTILNVDTDSLQEKSKSEYWGVATKGMKLKGSTSGAEANVVRKRIISDEAGTVIGTFFIPDPNVPSNPRFETGTKTLLLISDKDNNFIPGEVISQVEAIFTASGEINITQETTISTRNAEVQRIPASDIKVIEGTVKEIKENTVARGREEDFIRTKDGQIIPLNAGDYNGIIARVAAEDKAAAATVAAKAAAVTAAVTAAKQQQINAKAAQKEITAANQALKAAKVDAAKPKKCGYKDPIAETFKVDEEGGMFITSIEVYFQKKDNKLPISCQIRSVIAGSPTSTILPFAEKTLEPKEIKVSQDASVPTKFMFDSPIYLKDETEYAIVLQTDSSNYFVWISRMGEVDISTQNGPESQQIIVSQQPYLGSLFKSQNGETWDASQLEDLKFTLYIAQFDTAGGSFTAFNPKLGEGNGQIAELTKNPITTISKDATIKLNNNITTPLSPGRTITQFNNLNTTGKLISTKGAVGIGSTTGLNTSNITVNNVGSGITPSTGNYTFTGVNLVSLTGIGTGATAQITVTNGTLGVATITNGGSGYSVGDVVTVKLGQLSENIRYNIGVVTSYNTLVVSNVQGSFDNTNQIGYINAGAATTFAYSGSAPVPSIITINPSVDGMHFKVSHKNHGMHSRSNKVVIKNVTSDLNPSLLKETYTSSATTEIKISSVGIFTSFENVSVSSTNPGYVLIDDEIISYTGVNAGLTPPTLTGITRGIDSTIISSHDIDDAVYSYQLNDVSLRRINTTHNMSDANPLLKNGIDEYYLKINTTSTVNGVVRDGTVVNGFPILRFSETASVGGITASATQNIQFEAVTPNVSFITPPGSSVSGRLRSVSATSVDGTEVSFIDEGFQQINLNQINYFDSPRLVASEVNETAYLSNLPSNKSLWFEFILQTNNKNISPVIDLDRVSMILTTNRIDAPVTDFIADSRVNQSVGDPHAAVYVSKKVQLTNPASSLDLRFSAQRPESSDIRVMYKLFRPDVPDSSQPYNFFPGYSGQDDGKSDINVNSSNDEDSCLDYTYKADNLPPFTGFMIKVIMSGTNQAKPPLIADLSVIALA